MAANEAPNFKFTLWPFVVGVLLLGLGTIHVQLYKKFTPVYTPTQCGDEQAILDKLDILSDSFHVGLTIVVSCINPNPYSINIVASAPGRVFIGARREFRVGQLQVLPGSSLSEYGNGTVRVRMNANISGPEAQKILPHFLMDAAVPVLMELQFDVAVDVSFGLRSWSASMHYRKDCGLNVAGVLVRQPGVQARMGPLMCKSSFEELRQLPAPGSLGDMNVYGRMGMGFSAAQVAPKEVAKGTLAKDVSLWTMMVLSFTFAMVFIYCAFFNGPSRFLLWVSLQRDTKAAALHETLGRLSPSERTAIPKLTKGDKREEETPLVSDADIAVVGAMGISAAATQEPGSDDVAAECSEAAPRDASRISAASSSRLRKGSPDKGSLLDRCSLSEAETPSTQVGTGSSDRDRERFPSACSAASVASGSPSKSLAVGSSSKSPSRSRNRALVRVRGATGPCADIINGKYSPVSEIVGGHPAYRKEGDGDIWLCFDPEVGNNWKVQLTKDKGTSSGFMHSDGLTADAELPGLAMEWKVWDTKKFEAQASVCLLVLPPDSVPVDVSGVSGPCADIINGIFHPTAELVGGRTAYRKDGDDDTWLCFDNEVGKNWKVQTKADRGSGTGYMHSDGEEAGASLPELALHWKVWDTEKFALQETVSVMASTAA